MKIGLAVEHLDPHRGGCEHWTYQFAERLLARGHEVHVVAQTFAPAALELPIVAHRLGNIRGRLPRARAAEDKLRGLELDVIHDMGMGWYCHVFESHDGSRLAQWEQKTATLPRWLRPAKRALVRVLPRYTEFRRLIARQLADPHRLILALSKMVADDFLRYHSVRPEQIRLIYNGVDTERFSPAACAGHRESIRRRWGVRPDETVFLFVGHDFVRKGLATAIRAAARLAAAGRPARLVVVGGKRTASYARLARRYGAERVTQFAGTVADAVPHYAAADVCVLPTFYDPCSLVVLEAASCGLPCITTRFNGAGELMTDGQDGYILDDPADDRALADRMERLLDPALRTAVGEAARRLALQHTLDRNCDEIEALYREVVQRGLSAGA